jgi:hypothetical protein
LEKAKTYFFLIVAVASLLFVVYKTYIDPPVKEKEIVKYEKVEVPKEIVKIEKQEVPIEKIKVIPKTKVVTKYIPQEVKDDNKEVLAIGTKDCPNGDKVIISAVLDKNTKETDIYAKIEKRKFQLFPGGEVGFKYGIQFDKNIGFSPEVSGYVRYDLFRVSDFYIGAAARLG